MYRVTDYSFLFQSMLGKNNMMNKNNISSMFGSIKVFHRTRRLGFLL